MTSAVTELRKTTERVDSRTLAYVEYVNVERVWVESGGDGEEMPCPVCGVLASPAAAVKVASGDEWVTYSIYACVSISADAEYTGCEHRWFA